MLLHPGFYALSAFIGAGLVFAGVSGACMMARLLALAPGTGEPRRLRPHSETVSPRCDKLKRRPLGRPRHSRPL
jgi:hypothetical protein